MIALTLQEIADAVSGNLKLAAGYSATSIVSGDAKTDSREVKPGEIYFARRGQVTDGHRFIGNAVEVGAALIIGEDQQDNLSVPQIIVDSADTALGSLAKYVVTKAKREHGLKVVAITGSNGKTTTKNLLAKMLGRLGNTVASEKSFNNEVGGPLTMLRVCQETEYLVVEMGASARGEIALLTSMAQPDYGVVLMVGKAHAGGFGGIQTTAATKGEMVEALTAEGVAVLNANDPLVAAMQQQARGRVRWFDATGTVSAAEVTAAEITVSAAGTSFILTVDGVSKPVNFPVLGEHHVANALAAAAVASDLGLDLQNIVEVLEATVRPAKWRMEVSQLPNEVTLINDAYNASPESMAAALKTLTQIADPAGRSIAVLGAMSELGDESGPEHDRIGLLAVRLRIGQVVVVGENNRRMYISAINEGAWSESEAKYFPSSAEALTYLRDEIKPHDTVLIKSSNAAGLRFLGDDLKEALS
ncbi:UDP-N-acetylmuramoyl-tripeptide--D-alanyl-D-alanine ligase [Canibacter zhoujuaniae]|uniref:UDP-N-acetylmuramoyl-tripeptide--D-alanyl-D- alanine ligase n=1 Tax=Canibacter zhoujuaniae TaxID=2708343 RepID=UPI00141FAD3E|nr:UDP-N-acetylmuramoyl-tripeptide--D-alanyl-D-alanine ligase [Canibacter zhoujuaniae]